MQAMVFTGPSSLEMQQLPEPEAAPDEVIVEVSLAGICGSELHGYRQTGFRVPPLVMGHEFVGTLRDGQRVTVNPLQACGTCRQCLAGRTQLCRQRQILGIHRAGAFAERVAVPRALVHPLPEDLADGPAAMVEPLANAVHALGLLGPDAPQSLAVLGAGTIGLTCLLLAVHRGIPVTVVDLSPERLQLAKELGADVVGTSLDGEYDAVVDAVGAVSTHAMSIEHLMPGGTTVWLGLLSDDAGFSAKALVRDEKHVTGSFAYTDTEFAEAIDLAGTVNLDWTTTVPLAEGVPVFHEMADGRTDLVKVLLDPRP